MPWDDGRGNVEEPRQLTSPKILMSTELFKALYRDRVVVFYGKRRTNESLRITEGLFSSGQSEIGRSIDGYVSAVRASKSRRSITGVTVNSGQRMVDTITHGSYGRSLIIYASWHEGVAMFHWAQQHLRLLDGVPRTRQPKCIGHTSSAVLHSLARVRFVFLMKSATGTKTCRRRRQQGSKRELWRAETRRNRDDAAEEDELGSWGELGGAGCAQNK